MIAIEFISEYPHILARIKSVIRPELFDILDSMPDPHDIVTPEAFFSSVFEAEGLVWKLFVNKTHKSHKQQL